jgi:proteasome accessory factor B
VRTYKVERIIQLKSLDVHFMYDRSFSLEEYFGNAWFMIKEDERFHVKIRFLPLVAGNVDEVCWHKTQSTHYETDGSLIFEADVDGLKEISWWILGYGDQAQVLEPPELRQLVADRVKDMYAYYCGDGTTKT